MPIYDFKCTNSACQHQFEELFKQGELDEKRKKNIKNNIEENNCLAICPKCDSPAKLLFTYTAGFKGL